MKLPKLTKLDWIGWAVAACIATLFVTTGFQGQTEKMAVVDIVSVSEKSNTWQAKQASFTKAKTARESLIEFMDKNRTIAPDQLLRMRELTVKDAPTDADKAELDKIKTDVQDKGKRMLTLQAKANLTPEEKQILDDYSRQSQNTEQYVNRWFQEFAQEMQQTFNQQREQVLDLVRTTAKQVAKAQGLTLVFDASAAPYGANDITDATLQALNKAP